MGTGAGAGTGPGVGTRAQAEKETGARVVTRAEAWVGLEGGGRGGAGAKKGVRGA